MGKRKPSDTPFDGETDEESCSDQERGLLLQEANRGIGVRASDSYFLFNKFCNSIISSRRIEAVSKSKIFTACSI